MCSQAAGMPDLNSLACLSTMVNYSFCPPQNNSTARPPKVVKRSQTGPTSYRFVFDEVPTGVYLVRVTLRVGVHTLYDELVSYPLHCFESLDVNMMGPHHGGDCHLVTPVRTCLPGPGEL